MSERRTRAVYVISVAAELAGVHPQTLRIYERKGLLEPARTQGGSRRYSDEDIALLQRIQDLTEAGPQPGRRAPGSSSSKPRTSACAASSSGPRPRSTAPSRRPTSSTAATSSP